MVQTIHSETILAGQKKIVLEKPLALHRIFLSVCVVRDPGEWYASKVSFDDPLFRSYYVLDGPLVRLETGGEDIFQGNVWIKNESVQTLLYTMTEILH